MAQAYGPTFAGYYNTLWSGFAVMAAAKIHDYYTSLPTTRSTRPVLDLCCGTGQLVRYFLNHGFHVTGVDLSEAMLAHARINNAASLQRGTCDFVNADATQFRLETSYGLCVATYDALNHLPSLQALSSCFTCVAAALVEGGCFVFDLNTRAGLSERWHGTVVNDEDDAFIIQQSSFDGQHRGEIVITGFVPLPGSDLYRRFDEAVYNTVFDLAAVRVMALQAGFTEFHYSRLDDLATPVSEPEKEDRIFGVATR